MFFFCVIINNNKVVRTVRLKKTIKIVGRVLGGLFIAIYLIVALCCTNVVQMIAGSWASSHFSSAWGGKVHISYLLIK